MYYVVLYTIMAYQWIHIYTWRVWRYTVVIKRAPVTSLFCTKTRWTTIQEMYVHKLIIMCQPYLDTVEQFVKATCCSAVNEMIVTPLVFNDTTDRIVSEGKEDTI